MSTGPAYAVIVPAGGRSVRMGRADKTRAAVGSATLLDRVLAATAHAAEVVVVGDPRPTPRPVQWCRESPVGAGPAAAVAAALAMVRATLTVLLAADLPLVTTEAVEDLVHALIGEPDLALDGVVAVDSDGRSQWLLSAWRTDALRAADLRPDGSLRAALEPLRRRAVRPPDPVALLDCDTPQDLARARELAT